MAKFFKVNVSVIVFNAEGKVLLQKRSLDEEVFPGLWGIPGGTVEMNDTTLDSALEREVMEEVGISIKNAVLLKNNIRAKELYGMLYLVYVAEYASGEPQALDGTESVSWKSSGELQGLEFTPTTLDTLILAYERRNTGSGI